MNPQKSNLGNKASFIVIHITIAIIESRIEKKEYTIIR